MDWLTNTQVTGGITLLSAALCVVLFSLFFRRRHGEPLEVTQLYVYPVKSLRGCALDKAHIGPYGLVGDRTFSLQRVHRGEGNGKRYETMLIGTHLPLALFTASMEFGGVRENAQHGDVVVHWGGRAAAQAQTDTTSSTNPTVPETDDTIRFPLTPPHPGNSDSDGNGNGESESLVEVDLHGSKTVARDMGDALSAWFSDRLGFEVRLVHIGVGSRPILGSLAPNSPAGLKKAPLTRRLRGLVPWLQHPPERLSFSDIAHYLVVTEESNAELSSRLAGEGTSMDVTKFRPNVVVRGAAAPFVEDFWAELTFGGDSDGANASGAGVVRMPLTANCYRCQSITVDYETGRAAADERGTVWKKLNKDRRVDAGAKYSPVFGRYGYCFGASTGRTLRLGQRAWVTRLNSERTVFDWALNASPDKK